MLKKILLFIAIILIFSIFFVINKKNYDVHKFLLINKANHPEFIPNSKLAKLTSFWFVKTKADLYWLESIQYIGSNVISADYKRYLYKMLNLITDLDPYFEHPYVIWELLLPDYNPRYEKGTLNEKNQQKNINEWLEIWLKWIKKFCDLEKIKKIEKEYNIKKIQTDKKYKNACKSYRIPFNLAYIYFFYKHDWIKAAKYYKVTASIDWSPSWAPVLAAIMQWKGWDLEKSILMFINMIDLNWLNKEDKKLATSFKQIFNWIISWKIPLNKSTLKLLNNSLKEAFPKEEEKDNILNKNEWKNYIKKTVRLFNLYYIEKANKKYKKDFWENSKDARELYNKWYLDYFPIDYQQYPKKWYWIAYTFNKEINHFDASEMRNYDEPYFKGILKKQKKLENNF